MKFLQGAKPDFLVIEREFLAARRQIIDGNKILAHKSLIPGAPGAPACWLPWSLPGDEQGHSQAQKYQAGQPV
ncbi:MAG: hypothetical protein K2J64_03590, partial [Desulfovibrio sp.]|nr:hypothetical protein [Desulfovibrio sp.]